MKHLQNLIIKLASDKKLIAFVLTLIALYVAARVENETWVVAVTIVGAVYIISCTIVEAIAEQRTNRMTGDEIARILSALGAPSPSVEIPPQQSDGYFST